MAHGRLRHRRQPRLGALLLLLERLERAGQRVLAHEGAVHDRRDQVGLELFRRDRRLELHREGVETGQSAVELAKLLLELERQQSLHAAAMRLFGAVLRVEQAQRDAGFVIGQRRIAGKRLVAAPERHLFRQLAQVPCGNALALHAGLRLGEREARGFAQELAQLRQVAAQGELAPRLVDHAHVHEQVRRRLVLRPHVGVEALAGQARRVRQDFLLDAPAARPRAFEELRDVLGHRHQAGADALRQRLHRPRHLVADHARHQPVECGLVDLVEQRERHIDRHAVERMSRLEPVGEGEARLADLHLPREEFLGHRLGAMAHQVGFRHEKQPGFPRHRVPIPGIE